MVTIDATNFDLKKAKAVTTHALPYYVFTADNGEKFIIMHGSVDGSIDQRANSAIGTFKSAQIICCFPEQMKNAGYNVASDLNWNVPTTFAFDGSTVYVMAV